jgi:hypothetical protein
MGVRDVKGEGGTLMRVWWGVVAAMLLTGGLAGEALAEAINCSVDRGNLCFQTRCNNAAKSERITFDFEANTYRFCPSRYNDRDCVEGPMRFVIRDTSIIGVSTEEGEASARSMFLNRNTGSLTLSLLTAGGIASIDFGACELRR